MGSRGSRAADIIGILRECRAAGVVTTNFHPKNLLTTKAGVRLIDYGSDIRPFTEDGFRAMVQRAWLTLRFHDREDLSALMRRAITDQCVSELEGWESLLAAIDPASKREVVDDAIFDIAQKWRPSRVLDFGCGHGRIAAALAKEGAAVVAFDPDGSLTDRWRSFSQDGIAVEWCTADVRTERYRMAMSRYRKPFAFSASMAVATVSASSAGVSADHGTTLRWSLSRTGSIFFDSRPGMSAANLAA